MDPRIARILTKLDALRASGRETFGYTNHRYELTPPLAESVVTGLEVELGVALPAAFRSFLREAGASGAGPYYGLLPPERWRDALTGDAIPPDFAARPFVFGPDQARDDATWNRLRSGLDEPFQGAITIADQGCGQFVALVVSGESRGRVIYLSLDGGVPFFPENEDFLDYYERWVDELSWGFDHSWFGTTMPGDEAALAAAAGSGSRRLAALGALHQVPDPTDATRSAILACAVDADPAIRAAAHGLVKKHAWGGALDLVAAVHDADSEVRGAALESWVASDVDAWIPEARRLLDDPEDGPARKALRALGGAKALGGSEIASVLRSGRDALRRVAIEEARTVPSREVFDVLFAIRAEGGDDPHATRLQILVAQLIHGALDEPRVDALLEVVLDAIASEPGPAPPTAAISGLAALARTRPRALTRLIELLDHAEPFFRFDATNALGVLGATEALPALRACVDDPAMPKAGSRSTSWSVGESAKRAIAAIESTH